MFGIIAINRGMLGISAWVQHDGKPELYPTREAADDNPQGFFDAYAAAHLDKFGQPWELDKPSPVY